MKETRWKYELFISYSHIADRLLATDLQSQLHRLACPLFKLRAIRTFRDETSLELNPHLWDSIVDAMDHSNKFLLLASPESSESRWVNKELAYWLEKKGSGSILIALTGGSIVWDTEAEDFDWARTDAIPETLRGVFFKEPLWADFREFRSNPSAAAENRFRESVASISAAVRGVAKDTIVGEDLRIRRKAQALAFGAGMILMVLLATSIFLGSAARKQAREIEQKNEKIADQNHNLIRRNKTIREKSSEVSAMAADAAEQLAEFQETQGIDALNAGDSTGAIAWTARALESWQSAAIPSERREMGERPVRMRLEYLLSQTPKLRSIVAAGGPIEKAIMSEDRETFLTVSKSFSGSHCVLRGWDVSTGEPRGPGVKIHSPLTWCEIALSDDGGTGAIAYSSMSYNSVSLIDIDSGRVLAKRDDVGIPIALDFVKGGAEMILITAFEGGMIDSENAIELAITHFDDPEIRFETGGALRVLSVPNLEVKRERVLEGPIMDASFSREGSLIACASPFVQGGASIWSAESLEAISQPRLQRDRSFAHQACISLHGEFVAFDSGGRAVETFSLSTGERIGYPIPVNWIQNAMLFKKGMRFGSANTLYVTEDFRVSGRHDRDIVRGEMRSFRVSSEGIFPGIDGYSVKGSISHVSDRMGVFSPWIVIANDNGGVQYWDSISNIPLSPLFGHSEKVTFAEFGFDHGKEVLVTCSEDGLIRKWETENIGKSLLWKHVQKRSLIYDYEEASKTPHQVGFLGEPRGRRSKYLGIDGDRGLAVRVSATDSEKGILVALVSMSEQDTSIQEWYSNHEADWASVSDDGGRVLCVSGMRHPSLAANLDRQAELVFEAARRTEEASSLPNGVKRSAVVELFGKSASDVEYHLGFDDEIIELKCWWDSDHAIIATSGSLEGGRLHLIDLKLGAIVDTILFDGPILDVAFGETESVCVLFGSERCQLFRVTEENELSTVSSLRGESLSVVALADDGSLFAGGTSGGELYAWSADSGESWEATGHNGKGITSLSIPHGNRALLSCGMDGLAQWRTLTDEKNGDQLMMSLEGSLVSPKGAVKVCSVDSTGHLIATATREGAVSIWDARSLRLIVDALPVGSHHDVPWNILDLGFSRRTTAVEFLAFGSTGYWKLPDLDSRTETDLIREAELHASKKITRQGSVKTLSWYKEDWEYLSQWNEQFDSWFFDYTVGLREYADRKYEAAADRFSKALEKLGESENNISFRGEVLLARADALWDMKRLTDARLDRLEASKTSPLPPVEKIKLGRDLASAAPETAEQLIREAIDEFSRDDGFLQRIYAGGAWTQLATVYAEMARWEDAFAAQEQYDNSMASSQTENRDPETAADVQSRRTLMALASGRMDSYRTHCSDLEERLKKNSTPEIAFYTGWACALDESGFENWNSIRSAMESSGEYHDNYRYFFVYILSLLKTLEGEAEDRDLLIRNITDLLSVFSEQIASIEGKKKFGKSEVLLLQAIFCGLIGDVAESQRLLSLGISEYERMRSVKDEWAEIIWTRRLTFESLKSWCSGILENLRPSGRETEGAVMITL